MKSNTSMNYLIDTGTFRKMKQRFILIALISITPSILFAQEKIGVLKLSPQHFIVSTLKVDFETAVRSHSSFIISPSMTGFDKEDEKVVGGGIGIAKRYYVMNADPYTLSGFYANVGLSYNYYDVWYQKRIQKQTNYYSYQDSISYTEYNETIHQIGGDFVFGYQVAINEVFYMDMYFGGGLRIGMSSLGQKSDYRTAVIEYAYNGIIPKIGITAGLKIR